VDIATAARELGISSEAVRQRLRRGGLVGRKQDNRWLIRLDRTPSEQPPERVETDDRTEPIDVSYRVRTDEDMQRALDLRHQELVVDVFHRVDAMYQGRLADKDATITEQAERIREWQARAAELQTRLEALEAQPEPRRPWWKWWG
jgi:hypothetical protein